MGHDDENLILRQVDIGEFVRICEERANELNNVSETARITDQPLTVETDNKESSARREVWRPYVKPQSAGAAERLKRDFATLGEVRIFRRRATVQHVVIVCTDRSATSVGRAYVDHVATDWADGSAGIVVSCGAHV